MDEPLKLIGVAKETLEAATGERVSALEGVGTADKALGE